MYSMKPDWPASDRTANEATKTSARPGTSGSGAFAEPTMTLSFFKDVLRRRFWLVVPSGIALAAVATLAILHWFEPVYRAQAWLRVSSRSPYVAFSEPNQFP